MSNINALVMEAIDKDSWRINEVLKDIVYEKVKEAKTRQNIVFDLENNDPTGEMRRIYAELNNKDQIRKQNVFLCQMYSAGGDWEYPVRYFLCQLIDGYCYGSKIRQYGGRNSFFVYIPINGNRLNITNKEYSAFNNGEIKKEDVPEPNEGKCWSELKDYLIKISNVPRIDES